MWVKNVGADLKTSQRSGYRSLARVTICGLGWRQPLLRMPMADVGRMTRRLPCVQAAPARS